MLAGLRQTAPRDQLLNVASERGELLVARIRLLLTSTLLLIPISSLVFDLLPGEGVVGLAVIATAAALSLAVYLLVRRDRSRPWLGLATSCLDVSLVSAALAAFLVFGEPHTAVNSKVVFEGYFIAIGATCLRYDRRACVAAGALAIVEYFAIALVADTFWELNETDLYAPFLYGAFSWNTQISRLILLLTATVLSFAVVTRSRELVRLSTRDPLTGLFNRGYFHERVTGEARRARRSGQPLTIAMVDVDRFKSFNDTHGHAAGDRVLQAIATALRTAFRTTDIVSRYGGEEFVIVMPDTDLGAASRKLEDVRQGIEATPIPVSAGKMVNVTISAGLAGLPGDGATEDELLAVADARLFQAKGAGRNRIVQAVLLLVLLTGASSPWSSSAAAQAVAPPVVFTPPAGTFVGNETVTLSAGTRAEIHYTLDGSLPTAMSPTYRGPITLDKSTRLRALAIAPGASGTALQGPVATEVYLRVAPDTRSFTSHLPVILIHTFESGALDALGTEHVGAALQVLEPTAGTSRIVGRSALDARIGIHVRGATSRNFPKTQYALELRGDADDGDRARPMLGLPSHADWVLSDPVVYDRSLIRNALAFDLSNRIGRYAPRTRFAEVFMVDDGGDVRAESFLGFFTLIEKIDRDADRVSVNRLPASAVAGPEATGGFIIRIDKGAPDFQGGGRWLQFVYPDAEDMRSAERAPQLDFISTFITQFAQAASAPGFRHPASGQHYSEFIDVDAWIDHHIINVLAKNVDGLRFSAYFHKNRGGRLAAGPVWDFDRSLGTPYDPRATEPEEWKAPTFNASDYFNEGWWRLLFRDPEFRARYRARFKALLDKEFSPGNLDRIVDGMASQVGDAGERNFRRWAGFPAQANSHAVEIATLKTFLRRRVAWIATRLDTDF